MDLSGKDWLETGIAFGTRTLGDGIDSSQISAADPPVRFHLNISAKETARILHSLKPVTPNSQIHQLVPKYVPKEKKPSTCFKKMKEPKFIPYEPYKGAVEPIIPSRKLKPAAKTVLKQNCNKNNIEIHDLVHQMSEMRAYEMNKEKIKSIVNDEPLITLKQWQKEKTGYETDIKNLRETNSHLENQLKLQSQVNSELKTLLVAAVGEDLETRVQHLTEDKLQLARALLNSANHLTSHQEQTEWLSGQCEVWRSKFLASSLMVEELARWKSALTIRISELQESIKCLLEDRKIIRKNSQNSCNNLKSIVTSMSFDVPDITEKFKMPNIIDLSSTVKTLSDFIAHQLKCVPKTTGVDSHDVPTYLTAAEKNAMKLLQNPVSISNKQEVVCNALLGAALICSEQVYNQNTLANTSCCSHCTGEIKTI